MVVTQAVGLGQLPAETNEFVGRTSELRQIDELLRSARLVTLVGPGGVGKTRVVLRAAAAAAPQYRDGLCLVELSALSAPELLPHTIARKLGLADQAGASQRDALLAHLAERRLLLILDTCEHLIDACAELTEAILVGAPRVTVLATSREPLDIDGETTLPLRPLPVSSPKVTGEEPRTFGELEESGGDAVQLFVTRATGAVPGFAITDENRGDLVRICQRLDGIPLAIELAAVQLRTVPLGELARRLEQLGRRLPLLDGGSDVTDGRHRTLRDAISWSYEFCTEAERTLWGRLSVFAGAFDVAAAKEVCADDDLDGDEIFETIIRLVDKSVLTCAPPPAVDGEDGDGDQPAWYRMLDTIHEFGAEMLGESGTEAAIHTRFIGRYLAKARYFAAHLTDEEQLDRFRELRREHHNIQAALQYSLRAPQQHRQGAVLANALYGYWHMSGLLAEGRLWYERVLGTLPETPTRERGWALASRGYLGAMQGEADEAVADASAGVEIGRQLGDELLLGRGYNYLTLALTIAGRYDEARAAATESERRLEALGDRTGLAILDDHWAHLSHLAGDPEGTLRYTARAIGRFGGAREWWASAWAHVIAGMALYWQPSRDEETARTLNKGLLLKHELGDMVGMAYCLEIHGWLAARNGRHERAAWLLGAADPLWTRAGGRLGGTAALEQFHDEAINGCRTALGLAAFDSLLRRGADAPPAEMVALAVADADAPGGEVVSVPQPDKLTDLERDVAFLAGAGLSAGQIGRQLFMLPSAVEEQLASVFGKLGISSADQLGRWLGESPVHR
jgi:predicted ATPase/DNA-binding CsgD family transcriptional regulator